MSLDLVTEQFKKTASYVDPLGKSIKFVFDEGVVHIDMTGTENIVSNEDKEADCTITTKITTLDDIRKGKINPVNAVFTGKVKIKGDMSLAMKLTSLMK
jgi:putative sterol carrier protein